MKKVLVAIAAVVSFVAGPLVMNSTPVAEATPTNCSLWTYIYSGNNTVGAAVNCLTQGAGSFTQYRVKVKCLRSTALGGDGSIYYIYGQWRIPGPPATYGTSSANCRDYSASGSFLSYTYSYQ